MNNHYCVYSHIDSFGNTKYIGSGTIYRANSLHPKSNRGKFYEDFVKQNGKLKVKILFHDLSKTESMKIESEVFDSFDRKLLLNTNKPSGVKVYPSIEKLKSIFEIDNSSPSGLRWSISRPRGILPGSQAGTLSSSGYYMVGVDSKIYLCHRIILMMHGFDVENKVVDHLNNHRDDNSLDNLRITDQSTNMQNRKLLKNNLSGITGVRFCDKNNRWVVQTRVDGRRITKSYSVNKYGYEKARNMAILYRNNLEVLVNEPFSK